MPEFTNSGLLDNTNLLADLMEEKVMDEKNFKKNFIIDVNFYEHNNRNLKYLSIYRFCSKKCYPRRTQFLKEGYLEMRKGELSEGDKITDPIEHIYNCCAQQNDFIKDELPLAEKIFRVFLKYNLQPLNTHKISQELNYYNLNNIYYLLSDDKFYGFKEVKKD